MHISALKIAKTFFDVYASGLTNATVVDIGAQNVNGSIKDVTPVHLKYVGVDFVAGPGVDVILDDPYKLPFDNESVDIIVSSSCFEHSEMFWILFLELLRVLKPSGLLYINVPSNGNVHRYPVDCWRFYPDSGQALVNWARKNSYEPLLLESFIGAQDGDAWNDFAAVFVKNQSYASGYSRRMVDVKSDFTNGLLAGNEELIKFEALTEDQEKLAAQHQLLQLQEQQLQQKEQQLQQKDQQIQDKEQMIHMMANSWSWKITKPLRSMGMLLRHLKR